MNSIFRARTVFSTVLFTILLMGAFASSMALENFPLTFEGASTPEKVSQMWTRLIKYKLWGTGESEANLDNTYNIKGVFMRERARIVDSLGYSGSAHGGLTYMNDQHTLGGPLLFNGPFGIYTGRDTILHGPSHFASLQRMSGNDWENNKSSVINGQFCLDNNDYPQQGAVSVAVDENGKPVSPIVKNPPEFKCNGDVEPFDSDLDLPILDKNFKNYDDYIESISSDGGVKRVNSTDPSVQEGNARVITIHVPPAPSPNTPYNIYVSGDISLRNPTNFLVRMQHNGRSTRIIVNGLLEMSSSTNIQVVYADENDEFDFSTGKWKGTTKRIENVNDAILDYKGDLLFYLNKGWVTQAMNEENKYVVEGTFIVPTELTSVKDHMNFAGQILGKNIFIDADFNSAFRFMPFEGASVQTWALGKLKEGDENTQVNFNLTKLSASEISFDFCFEYATKDYNGSHPAIKEDIKNSDDVDVFPLCKDGKSKHMVFKANETIAMSHQLVAVDDGIDEGEEYFYIKIFNLAGASLSNPSLDNLYRIFIEDNVNKKIVGDNDTLYANPDKEIGLEDVEFKINSFPVFYSTDGKTLGTQIQQDYSVEIQKAPKGVLLLDGKKIETFPVTISSDDMIAGKLKYRGLVNDYAYNSEDTYKSTAQYRFDVDPTATEDPVKGIYLYDELQFKVEMDGKVSSSDVYKLLLEVMPVNDSVKIVHLDASSYSDKNIVKKDTLKVDEDAVVGAVVGHAWALDTADANHHDKLDTVKYTFEKSKTTLKANEKDITEAFEIDRLTGDITVKKALDFETIHTYKGRVIATDNGVPGNRGAVLADTFDFVIELNDVDEEIETHDSTIHTMTITGVSGKDTLIGYEDVTFPVLNSFFPAYKTARIVTKEKDGQKTDEQNTIYETPITDFRVVVEAPSKGSLTYFDHKVTEKDTIPSDSLKAGMLKYTSELNEFGDSTQKFEKYASFKFRLFYKDKSMPSKTKTMFVDMTPVNDAPEIVYLNVGKPDVSKTDKNIIKNNTFSVEEDATAGSVVGYAFAIDTADSKHNSPTTLKYSLGKSLETLKGGEKQVTDAFEINEMTGAITLKDGVALDYDKDSIYHGQVIVTDNGVPGNRDAKFFLKDSIALTIVLEKGPAKTDVITVPDTIIIGTDGKNIYRGYEDIEFPIDSFPAFKRVVNIKTKGTDGKIIAEETYESLVDYSVKIESVSKGTLMYKGQKVDLKNALIVPSKDVKAGLLTFKGLQDEFGDSAKAYVYAELKFSILRDGAKKYSETKTMKIVVKPMNDKPTMENVSLVVSDDNPIGKVVGGVKAKDEVDSKYDNGDKLTYKIAPVEKLGDGEKDFSEAFEIDSKTGDIKVIKTLDYHLDSVYVGRVVATDNGVPGDRDPKKFLSTSAEIRIKLVLGNRTPSTKDTIIVSKITDSGDAIGYEDIAFSITRFPAYEDYKLETEKKDGKVVVIDTILVNPLDDYDIAITRLPTKGELTFDGKAVKPGDVISSDDLKKGLLKYKGLPNDFGKIADSFMYDSLSFAILYEEHVSIAKLMKFQMKPVNDKPEVTTKNFTIAENISVGAVAVTVVAQDSVDMNRDAEATLTYKFEAVKDLKDGEQDAMSVFEIDSKTGEVKLNKALDYYQDSIYHGIVVVTDNGVPGDRKNTLSDIADIYIKLVAGLRAPVIQNDTFYVAENSPAKTLVGKIVAHDVEDDDADLVIGLLGSSNEFVVASDGKITVKQGAVLDYETKREYTLKVNVKDSDGLTADGSVVILIDDVREPATLNDTIFHVPENVSKGHVVGVVVPNNPNKNTLKFKIVTDNDKFKIRDDGTIITNGDIDYEEQKVYKLKVVMDDDGDKDTAIVTINVDNVEERSVVKITRADDGDTIWINPDTIYTNKYKIDFEWTLNGKLRPDSIVEYSKDGTYLFSVCETDPSMDLPGCDTAIVKIDNSIPKVRISKSAEDMSAITGVTIVEQVDKNDTNFYVNHEDNIVTVGITDKGMGVDSTFTVQLRLDTLKNIKNVQEKIKKISKTEITLDDAEKAQTKRTKVDDDTYEVTFKKLVGDDMVTVTYYTDKNGDAIRDLDGNAFMKVTYDTELNGEPIKVSYNVDADNGKIVENENGGRYEYYYSYVDKFGGLVGVNYSLDEKGKFAKTDAGDLGYKVSYTYKNRFGNTATKNISVVVDKIVPQVKILSPENKYVSRVSGVDVKWTVDNEVQDTLVIQALKNGLNKVIRTYRDKAGNEASDTVEVFLKSPKELNVHVEKPVTIVNEDSVRKYYDNNPPEKGQSFAVSIYNPYADKEVETLIGGTFGKKKGGQKEVYDGMEGHLGPTLLIDALAPRCGDKTAGGLCTLDDLIERDGKISLEAGGGWDRKKVSVDEYVEQYCSDDFRKDYKNDPAKANLYNTRLRVTIWIYTNIGGFLDEYSFTQEINDPDYVSEIGEVEMAFEMKPDMDGNVLSAKGRLLGTGAYIFNTEVKSVSELRCKLPSEEIGHKRVLTDTLRKPFGYKRPSLSKGKKK